MTKPESNKVSGDAVAMVYASTLMSAPHAVVEGHQQSKNDADAYAQEERRLCKALGVLKHEMPRLV